MKLSIKKLEYDAKVPSYAHGTDAGMDLYYYGPDTMLDCGAQHIFTTGITMAIPAGFAGLIWDKGGLANKQGLKVMGGVVDAGYRGQILVGLLNTSQKPALIIDGQKIAQMIIQEIHQPEIEVVNGSLLPPAEDERGEGKFGSTGLM